MPAWLQITLAIAPVLALVWNMINAKADRARLEGAFAATVDAKLAVLNQRFDGLERGQDAVTGTIRNAMDKLELHGQELAVLKDRSSRGTSGR